MYQKNLEVTAIFSTAYIVCFFLSEKSAFTYCLHSTEAATGGALLKKLFLEILQNP